MGKQMESGWNWLPIVATACSIIACYGTLVVVALLSLMGLGIAINEGAWAGAISAFAVLAALGTAYGYRRHGRVGPIGLAVVGAALVLWAMYGEYNRAVEVTGFAALVVATFWDWRAKKTPQQA